MTDLEIDLELASWKADLIYYILRFRSSEATDNDILLICIAEANIVALNLVKSRKANENRP